MKSSMPLIRVPMAGFLGMFLASGCASIVKQSYRNTPAGPSVVLLPYSGATQVYGQPDGSACRGEHPFTVTV